MASHAAGNSKLIYYSSDFSTPTSSSPLCGWTCSGSGKAAANVKLGTTDAPLTDFFPEGSQAYELLAFKGIGNVPWSNSSFADGGQANEWLISPAIDLTGSADDVMLDFDVLSYGSTNECKFEVYVSSTGNSPADFSSKAVYSGRQKGSTREIVTSTIHKALKGVGGGKIWIAFVNKSTDAQLTGFSGIKVSKYDLDLTNKAPSFTTAAGSFEVAVELSIMTPVSCKGFVATLETAGGGMQEYVSDKQLSTKYNTYQFTFPEPLDAKFGDTIDYTISITPNYEGAETSVMPCTLVCREGYPAVCVMEEGTGAWCGYCVRGAAALKYYEETLGDRFIGIAVHDEDSMEIYDYLAPWMEQSGLRGFPSAWINRRYTGDPAQGCETVLSEANRNVGQRTSIDNLTFDPETFAATVTYSIEYCYDMPSADISVVAVVTENECVGTGSGWMQNNYYSGTSKEQWLNAKMPEEMWEYIEPYTSLGSYVLPSQIPFNHVARGIYNNYYGDGTTMPAEWKAYEPQQFTLSFDFPTSDLYGETAVQDWENTSVAVFLLNRATGEILNAAQIHAIDYSTDNSSVNYAFAPAIDVKVAGGNVTVTSETDATAVVYCQDGSVLCAKPVAAGVTTFRLDASHGCCIIKVSSGNDSVIKKVIY